MVKKIIPAILLLLLLLCACGVDDEEESTPVTTGETEHIDDLYIPNSIYEQESGGAVRAYRVNGSFESLYMLGEDVLLLSEDGEMLLQDPEGITATPAEIEKNWECLTVSDAGIGYFLPETREVVIRNARLLEINRFTLPEDMIGMPVISLTQNEVYYCTAESVRAKDMNTDIARLLRQNGEREQSLTGIFFGDTVIACKVSAPSETTMYLSTEDGEMRYSDSSILRLETDENRFFAVHRDGIVDVQVVGALDDEEMQVFLPESDEIAVVWEQNGIITCSRDEEMTCFAMYSLDTGTRVSEVRLSGISRHCAVTSGGKWVWLLTENVEAGESVLLRWDPELSPVTDARACFGPLYSEEEPDTDGLEQCQARTKEIKDRFGVQVVLYQEALDLTGDRHLRVEYQPESYDQVLDQIEDALKTLPDGILLKRTNIQIGIVREISGRREPLIEMNGQKTVMILPVDCNIRQSVFLCVGYALDTALTKKGRVYEDWDDLNPEDFQYGDSPELLPDGFLNDASTKDARDERAYLFAAAMDEENDAFTTDALQRKLRYLCEVLRAGLGITDEDPAPPWEQYLK